MNDELAWTAVLDAFEDRLSAQREALELGAPGVVPSFVAPALAAPLPDSLLDRAVALIADCRQLTDDLAAALEATDAALAKIHETPASVAAQPVYFDSRV